MLRKNFDLLVEPALQGAEAQTRAFVVEIRERVVLVVETELEDKTLNIPRLVEQLLISVLGMPNLEDEACRIGISMLARPSFRKLARLSPVPGLVKAVFIRFRDEFLEPRHPDGTVAVTGAVPRKGCGANVGGELLPPKLSVLVIDVLNDIVRYDDFAPVRRWWKRAICVYAIWIAAAFVGSEVMIQFANDTRSEWLILTTMMVTVLAAVVGEIALTVRFISTQTKRLTACIMLSLELNLMELLTRDDMRNFIREVSEVVVDAVAKHLGIAGYAVMRGWEAFGGGERVLELIAKANEEIFEPKLLAAFDSLLDRKPVESADAASEQLEEAWCDRHGSKITEVAFEAERAPEVEVRVLPGRSCEAAAGVVSKQKTAILVVPEVVIDGEGEPVREEFSFTAELDARAQSVKDAVWEIFDESFDKAGELKTYTENRAARVLGRATRRHQDRK